MYHGYGAAGVRQSLGLFEVVGGGGEGVFRHYQLLLSPLALKLHWFWAIFSNIHQHCYLPDFSGFPDFQILPGFPDPQIYHDRLKADTPEGKGGNMKRIDVGND